MPLCVNLTFFTAWFLTSAAAGGDDPSSAPVHVAFLTGRASRRDVQSPGQGVLVNLQLKGEDLIKLLCDTNRDSCGLVSH